MPLTSLLNLSVSWALLALIWIIQLVHYPSFRYVSTHQWHEFHRHHSRSITWIVMPLMLIELGLAGWFTLHFNFYWEYLVPMILVILIWVSTFLIQIPIHKSLGATRSEQEIEKLIRSNWLRTILWSLKAIWLLWICLKSG